MYWRLCCFLVQLCDCLSPLYCDILKLRCRRIYFTTTYHSPVHGAFFLADCLCHQCDDDSQRDSPIHTHYSSDVSLWVCAEQACVLDLSGLNLHCSFKTSGEGGSWGMWKSVRWTAATLPQHESTTFVEKSRNSIVVHVIV